MRFRLWLAWKYLRSGRKFLGLTAMLSIFGMALGVASLIVAMAVVSGYQSTLQKSVIDIFGHLLVSQRGPSLRDADELQEKLREILPDIVATTSYVATEAVLARNKKLSGVILHGIEPDTVSDVLNLKSRLLAGEFDFSRKNGLFGAVIGKSIAKKFSLKVGDPLKIVIPVTDPFNAEKFRPRLAKFRIAGILDLGRHDFDSRTIIADQEPVRKFAAMEGQYSGVRVLLRDPMLAMAAKEAISKELGFAYWTRDWKEVNRNLFEAVEYEKFVIFIVILVIVIAACFNICSTLFVSVMRRYADLGILKTMGAKGATIVQIFVWQGLIIGFVGVVLGLLLGFGACYLFEWAQSTWQLIPGEIYRIDNISVELRWQDLLLVFGASLLICFVSTLAPALRGARLSPVEGLRYE